VTIAEQEAAGTLNKELSHRLENKAKLCKHTTHTDTVIHFQLIDKVSQFNKIISGKCTDLCRRQSKSKDECNASSVSKYERVDHSGTLSQLQTRFNNINQPSVDSAYPREHQISV